MGLYFNFSIVFLYLFIVAIYIIKNKLIKNNTIKIKKERLNLLNPKRYFRYFKLFINSKILIVICIFSIISNSITIFQNRKYENLYKDKEEINAVALVVNNGEEKEYNYVYKIKISRSIPNDYSAKIYYKEIVNKVQITYLAGEEAGFIDTDAKELTKTLGIRSIVIMILGDILYIYFLVYILKEFKRISE